MNWDDLIQATTSVETDLPEPVPEKERVLSEILDYSICGKKVELANPNTLVEILIEDEEKDLKSPSKPIPLRKDTSWEIKKREGFDPCEIPEFNGTSILDCPEDCVIYIFTFLNLRDVICVGQVNIYWKYLHRNNRIWKPIVNAYFECTKYKANQEKLYLRYLKRERGEWNIKFENDEWEDYYNAKCEYYRKHEIIQKKKSIRGTVRKEVSSKRLLKRAKYFKYWTIFRRRMRIKEQKMIYEQRVKRLDYGIKQYQKIFGRWNRLFETCYIFFIPFSLFLISVSSLLVALFFIGVIPMNWFEGSSGQLIFVCLVFVFIIITLIYVIVLFLVLMNSFFNAILNYENIDLSNLMLYFSYLSLPIILLMLCVKALLPPEFNYSALMSVLYVGNFVSYVILGIVCWRFGIVLWKKKQKLCFLWSLMMNIAMCWFTAFFCIYLDNDLKFVQNPFTEFVFIPVWVFSFYICCLIPIVGWLLKMQYGWGKLIIFVPFAAIHYLPMTSFILLALILDNIIPKTWYFFIIVFAPLLIWEILMFLIAMIFACIRTMYLFFGYFNIIKIYKKLY